MVKYGVVLDGRVTRVCKTLKQALSSQVYRPWYAGCRVYEFSYSAPGVPVGAIEV